MKHLKAFSAWFLLALTCISANVAHAVNDAPIVSTKYGEIQGTAAQLANKYLGIPYALPPVGQLRWTEPLRAMPWYPQVLNATTLKPACPQYKCAERMPAESCPPVVFLRLFVKFFLI
jgi:para-nitrobenzyl esterase